MKRPEVVGRIVTSPSAHSRRFGSTLAHPGRPFLPACLHRRLVQNTRGVTKKQNKSALMHNYTMTLPSAAHIVLKAIACFTPAVYMIASRSPPRKIRARVGRHHFDDP